MVRAHSATQFCFMEFLDVFHCIGESHTSRRTSYIARARHPQCASLSSTSLPRGNYGWRVAARCKLGPPYVYQKPPRGWQTRLVERVLNRNSTPRGNVTSPLWKLFVKFGGLFGHMSTHTHSNWVRLFMQRVLSFPHGWETTRVSRQLIKQSWKQGHNFSMEQLVGKSNNLRDFWGFSSFGAYLQCPWSCWWTSVCEFVQIDRLCVPCIFVNFLHFFVHARNASFWWVMQVSRFCKIFLKIRSLYSVCAEFTFAFNVIMQRGGLNFQFHAFSFFSELFVRAHDATFCRVVHAAWQVVHHACPSCTLRVVTLYESPAWKSWLTVYRALQVG